MHVLLVFAGITAQTCVTKCAMCLAMKKAVFAGLCHTLGKAVAMAVESSLDVRQLPLSWQTSKQRLQSHQGCFAKGEPCKQTGSLRQPALACTGFSPTTSHATLQELHASLWGSSNNSLAWSLTIGMKLFRVRLQGWLVI